MTDRVGRWAGPAVLVVGPALIASGLALLSAQPRAVSVDIGPPPTAAVAPAAGTTTGGTTAGGPAPAPDAPVVPAAEPVTLTLPNVGEPVPVVPVGVLPTGALQLPERPTTLGWYAAGAAPGARAGTAVVAGHVDSARFGAGPLARLFALHVGDVLTVTDAAGTVHRFTVASRHSYRKPNLPSEVFRRDGPAQLAVITCGGAFDRRTGNYADNVLVIATPA